MFKLIYIFLIAFSSCIIGSSTIAGTATNTKPSTQIQYNSVLKNEELSSVITIRVEQISKYQNLKFRLIALEDSRCAIGVACIWAGQLVVTLEVSNEYGQKEEVKLIRKREPKIANAFGYSLFLVGVETHPKKGKVIQLSEQVIKVKIVKLM